MLQSNYLTNQTFRRCNTFLLLTKWLCEPDEMASRAGFGPRAVGWRPLG